MISLLLIARKLSFPKSVYAFSFSSEEDFVSYYFLFCLDGKEARDKLYAKLI